VRGDGRTYAINLNVRASRNLLYRSEFETQSGAWLEIRAPFAAFKPTYFGTTLPGPKADTSEIEYVGFILSDKKPGAFRLEIERIGTY
jgi:Complex I intermediate-associated protein 30 (CIA30)